MATKPQPNYKEFRTAAYLETYPKSILTIQPLGAQAAHEKFRAGQARASIDLSLCHGDVVGDLFRKSIRPIVDWALPTEKQLVNARPESAGDKRIIAVCDHGGDRAADVNSEGLVDVVSRR